MVGCHRHTASSAADREHLESSRSIDDGGVWLARYNLCIVEGGAPLTELEAEDHLDAIALTVIRLEGVDIQLSREGAPVALITRHGGVTWLGDLSC
jgi:hypothetical protein